MDLSILRSKIEQVGAGQGGLRRFPIELQREVVEAAEKSKLGRKQFLVEIGLNAGQFYVMRSAVQAGSKFCEIKVTHNKKEEDVSGWEVSGPGGMRVNCRSVEDVAKLWRALC